MLYFGYARSNPTSAVPIFLIAGAVRHRSRLRVPGDALDPAIGRADRRIAPPDGDVRGQWQLGLVIGPASSGLLYDHAPATPYAAAAVCFAVSAAPLATLRLRHHQERTPAEQKTTLHHALEGLRFIRGQPVLFGAIALDLFAVLFGGAVALLPAIAEDRLHVGNVGYGWLRAPPGYRRIVVSVLLAVHPLRRRIGRWLLIVVGVFGASTVVLGLTHRYTVAFLALVVLAAADAVSVFIRSTIVPLATPDPIRVAVGGGERVHRGLQ